MRDIFSALGLVLIIHLGVLIFFMLAAILAALANWMHVTPLRDVWKYVGGIIIFILLEVSMFAAMYSSVTS